MWSNGRGRCIANNKTCLTKWWNVTHSLTQWKKDEMYPLCFCKSVLEVSGLCTWRLRNLLKPDKQWLEIHLGCLADHLENMRPLTEEETKIFFEKLNKWVWNWISDAKECWSVRNIGIQFLPKPKTFFCADTLGTTSSCWLRGQMAPTASACTRTGSMEDLSFVYFHCTI